MIGRVARQLGVGAETLRYWVNQAEIDGGQRPGTTSEDQRRITELEKENRELRRANEILQDGLGVFRGGGARPPVEVVVAYIDAYREKFGVEPIWCAGINRHGEGDGNALHRRISDPRWPRVMHRRL